MRTYSSLWFRGAGRWAALLATACSLLFANPGAAQSNNHKRVAAGEFHSIWVAGDGTVRAWGDNSRGQLGDGTKLTRPTPVLVRGIAAISHVSSGLSHTLALDSSGRIFAWGENLKGQLGTGDVGGTRTIPAQVTAIAQAKHVVAFGNKSAAIDSQGRLWVWGEGQGSRVPVLVAGVPASGEAATAVALGRVANLILLSDGTVKSWARSETGEVSVSTINRDTGGALGGIARLPSPTYVISDSGQAWKVAGTVATRAFTTQTVVDAAATDTLNQVVMSDGSAYGTGFNEFGQIGDGSNRDSTTPSRVFSSVPFAQIAVNTNHTVAMSVSGEPYAWGYNAFGEIGGGGTQYVDTPLHSIALNGFAQVAPGRNHTLGVGTNGQLFAWGRNNIGQLGVGFVDVGNPTAVTTPVGMKQVAAAQAHSVALATDGTVYAWGDNGNGQIGNGASGEAVNRPALVAGVTGAVRVRVGARSSFALTAAGDLYGWGKNGDGDLGAGDYVDALTPRKNVALAGGRVISEHAAGRAHSLALASDGTLWVWGANDLQQHGLGDGGQTSKTSAPRRGPTFTAIAVAAGFNSSVAVRDDGTVWTWGELVLGTASTSVPVQVTGLPRITKVAASGYTFLALGEDGVLWAWGRNFGDHPRPVVAQVRFKSMAAGPFADGILALDIDDRWWGIGYNAYGQLGFGGDAAISEIVPVRVYNPGAGALNSTEVIEFLTDKIGPAAERFFLSAHPSSSAVLDTVKNADGSFTWSRTGRGFRAWTTREAAPASASEVYRFYCLFPDGKPNTHFYTANPADRAALQQTNPTNTTGQGCRYEGIDFYAVAPNFATQSCPAGYHPVYRAFNNRVPQNDGNHRMSTSYVDHLRSTKHLGFNDEGTVFCSPVSSVPGGDLHAYHSYPGPEVVSGTRIQASFVFANNGPGHGNGARVAATVPTTVNDWVVTCTAQGGAACPDAALSAAALRSGLTLTPLPAGGTVTFALSGTAPALAGAAGMELRFGNSIQPSQTAVDTLFDNNTTRISSTQVVGVASCTYGLSVSQLALSASGGATQSTVASRAGCPLTATVAAAASSWLTVSLPNGASAAAAATTNIVRVNAAANASALSRSGTVQVGGQMLTVYQDGQPTQPAVGASCISRISPVSEHASGDGYSLAPVAVSVVSSACSWKAVPDQAWIKIVTGASGVGAGTVTYAIEPNPDATPRTGKIRMNNVDLDIYQEAKAVNSGGNEGGGGDGGGDGGGGGSSSGGTGDGPGE